ncbi:MAG: M20/M25/M40 family metallo-hydrolase, partial [Rhodobacterales bacterium]
MAEETLRRICTDGASAMGLTAEVEYVRGAPALINDDAMVSRAEASMTAHFGTPPSVEISRDFGAEDFSYFSERLPALQLHIGSAQPGRRDRLHNSDYQPDEAVIGISAKALARLAFDLLARDAG